VRASTQRTFGKFVDLAAVTELPINNIYRNGVPQALDQVSLSYGFSDLNAGAGLSLIHQLAHDGTETMLVGANVTKSFGDKLSVYGNAYIDLNNSADYGAFIGLSMPFGKDTNASAGGSYSKGSYAATAEVSKPLDTNFGSYGYRVSASDNQGDARLSAEGSYRSPFAIGTARLANTQGKISGSANVDGSIVATKGGLFLGNPINDSFAVVDAGFEGIDVSYENRFVGKTGKNGKLLISQLHSYQNSKITINPENLPLNSSVSDTEKHVATRAKSGVLIDFGVKKDGNGVIVILKDANDKFLSPGTSIKVEGKDEPFVMGYDGEVYLSDIGEHISLTAEGANTTCAVSFEFKADATTQTSIGPLQCL
jgi:outer membrane usher protein